MLFGEADYFAGALDVVAHEMGHGVTDTSAGLLYKNQPGALNEAMSDVFGEMLDREAGSPAGRHYRAMGHPPRRGGEGAVDVVDVSLGVEVHHQLAGPDRQPAVRKPSPRGPTTGSSGLGFAHRSGP